MNKKVNKRTIETDTSTAMLMLALCGDKTNYMKQLYYVLIIGYSIMILIYPFKYHISYYLVGTHPEIVETRDLTQDERNALKRAEKIRDWFTTSVFLFSIIIAFLSVVALYIDYSIFSKIVIKAFLIISIGIVLVIGIAKGMHFIGQTPIR